MAKKFNVTGSCNPQRHYMVDIAHKFNQVMELIEQGEYFTINRPRQYGKTTMLNTLFRNLQTDGYLVAYLSFEGIGDSIFQSEKTFATGFLEMLSDNLKITSPEIAAKMRNLHKNVSDLKSLSKILSDFIADLNNANIVLLIDEVDKSSNNQLFLSFLGMLREQYLAHDKFSAPAFKSVILAGVHDVKSLKLKIREGGEIKLNSPWNIAADFNVDMSFNPDEIKTMLVSYAKDKKVKMDFAAIAERIYYYTSGYPFLVSKICKNIDEEETGQNPSYDPKNWTLNDIDWSFKELTRDEYTTTNFDDLVKNLENNPDLYALTYAICFGVDSEKLTLSRKDPVVDLGIQYGILKYQNGRLAIHNRVYEQVVYDYLRSRQLTKGASYNFNGYLFGGYITNDGKLNIEKALLKFQEFMKEHYSDKDTAFLEREGRLVFMSFLKPVINGKGFMWKEPVAGDERRMDIVVTYGKEQKEVIELKIWRGNEYHQLGLKQLSSYLDFQGLKNGYLLIFDFNKNKQYKSDTIKFEDKDIFAIWV